MAKYEIPDDHEWTHEQEPDPAEPPAELTDHVVTVTHTFDPSETGGYGRHRYEVHIGHDFEDSPVAVFATKHRWAGNFWREVGQVDWQDVPGPAREQVAAVVDCEGQVDLHPGDRVVGADGRETWRRYPGDDAYADKCPECSWSGHRAEWLAADQRECRNRDCPVAAFMVAPEREGGDE